MASLLTGCYDLDMAARKNPHAVALGKLGGNARAANLSEDERAAVASLGGATRAENLTPARRSEIARDAAKRRWRKAAAKKA